MADANAQRLVIKITGDTSELEARLAKLKSTAEGILRGTSGATKPSVLAAEQRRLATEASSNAKVEVAASKERIAAMALEAQQLKSLNDQKRTVPKTGNFDAATIKGLDDISLRIANARRDSKAAGMEIYRNIGNPFLVISSMSQRITGIYQLSRDSEEAVAKLEEINHQLQIAKKNGQDTNVKNLTASANAAAEEVEKLNKKMQSFSTRMRGAADFVVNQFMTAALFGIFQVMSMAVAAVASSAQQIAVSIIDPLAEARKEAESLGAAVNKLGGVRKLSMVLDLSDSDRRILEFSAAAAAGKETAGILLDIARGKREGVAGMTPGYMSEDDIKKAVLIEQQRRSGVRGFVAQGQELGGLTAGDTVKNFIYDAIRAPFAGLRLALGGIRAVTGQPEPAPQTRPGERPWEDEFRKNAQIQYRRGLYGSILEKARELQTLENWEVNILREVGGLEGQRVIDAHNLLSAEKSRVVELGRAGDELERQRYALTGDKTGLNYGEGADMDKWFIKSVDASRMIERLQRAQTNFSAQMTARQQRQQLGQAAADVTRAGIGRPGQSGFELAAAVLEARAKAQEAREQIRIQRRQEAIQQKIEYWTKVQTNAKRQQDIMSNAMSIALNNAQMILTVDPASGQLLARYVSADVYKMMMAAAANNTNGPR